MIQELFFKSNRNVFCWFHVLILWTRMHYHRCPMKTMYFQIWWLWHFSDKLLFHVCTWICLWFEFICGTPSKNIRRCELAAICLHLISNTFCTVKIIGFTSLVMKVQSSIECGVGSITLISWQIINDAFRPNTKKIFAVGYLHKFDRYIFNRVYSLLSPLARNANKTGLTPQDVSLWSNCNKWIRRTPN